MQITKISKRLKRTEKEKEGKDRTMVEEKDSRGHKDFEARC